jgi:hypothetical protein
MTINTNPADIKFKLKVKSVIEERNAWSYVKFKE